MDRLAGTPNRWVMLGVSMVGQATSSLYVNAAPFLIPYLHLERGLTLVQAGFVAAAPTVGMMLTLIVWGAIVDRIGERASMGIGLALLTVGSIAAAFSTSFVALAVFLFLGGMGGASTNSASGRVAVGREPSDHHSTAAVRRWACARPHSRSASGSPPCSCRTSSLRTVCVRRSSRSV